MLVSEQVPEEHAIPAPRLRLRPLAHEHLAQTLAWVNDPELKRLLDRVDDVPPEEHDRWFQELSRRSDCQYFAIERDDDGRHIGNVWLWAIDVRHRRAEVRILIGERSWTDQGLGTEAITLLSRHAFDQLNLHKLVAYVLAFNPRAKRAFEKAEFTTVAVLRADRWAVDRYVDVFLLERLREDTPHSVSLELKHEPSR